MVQVSDWHRPRSGADRISLGDGTIDNAAIVRAVRKTGYAGPYVLEIFSGESLPDSIWRADLDAVIEKKRRCVRRTLGGKRRMIPSRIYDLSQPVFTNCPQYPDDNPRPAQIKVVLYVGRSGRQQRDRRDEHAHRHACATPRFIFLRTAKRSTKFRLRAT